MPEEAHPLRGCLWGGSWGGGVPLCVSQQLSLQPRRNLSPMTALLCGHGVGRAHGRRKMATLAHHLLLEAKSPKATGLKKTNAYPAPCQGKGAQGR